MNWDLIQGNWKQTAGKAKEQWGKHTDHDIDVVAGGRGQLVGALMTFQEDIDSFKDRIARAESERNAWRAAGSEEKYLEAYFLVEALELQFDEQLRRHPADKAQC